MTDVQPATDEYIEAWKKELRLYVEDGVVWKDSDMRKLIARIEQEKARAERLEARNKYLWESLEKAAYALGIYSCGAMEHGGTQSHVCFDYTSCRAFADARNALRSSEENHE